jgi:hypothetical protein
MVLRRALILAVALLCSALAMGPALAQAPVLPALDASGMTLPLSVEQLDDFERPHYAQLGDDDARRRFLYTRGYLRYARLVANREMAPIDLPPLPERINWGRQYLTADEARNVLDVALGMNMIAMMQAAQPR